MFLIIKVLLISWMLTGVLGWGWASYSGFLNDGPDEDPKPVWRVTLIALIAGPFLVHANYQESLRQGVFYWGLRYP